MAKLYYGNGECLIEEGSNDIMGVEIRYKGAI